jgi:hypothetical protein
MEEDRQAAEALTRTSLENARVGYQVAVDLWAHIGQTAWSVMSAMLVAHSIVIAGIGLALTSSRQLTSFSIVLPVLGLVLCVTWLLLATRTFAMRTYYVLSARELEENYLAREVKTIARGGSFAEGEAVELVLKGTPRIRRIGCLGRARAHWLCYALIGVFGVLYIVSLFEVL